MITLHSRGSTLTNKRNSSGGRKLLHSNVQFDQEL